MNVIEALNWRYAVRKFSDYQLSEKSVDDLLHATLLSPTSYGLQPYRLIVITDRGLRQQLMRASYGQEKVLNCSHLVVFAAQTEFGDEMIERYIDRVVEARNIDYSEISGLGEHMKEVFQNKNAQQKREWAHQQAYIALGTLLTSAALMKIDACPMGGIETDIYDKFLGLNEKGMETSVICSLGIRHREDQSAELAKVRYDKSEMVLSI
tara:strand:- start:1653 stop:2279 length:627 start_codon:yes stop_codon:yes gene_type:complete